MRVARHQYIAALEELRRRAAAPEYFRMLGAHWAATRRTVSMAQLAMAAGYPSFRYANLRYGGLAARIAKYGEIRLPPRWSALNAIATWAADPRNAQGHFAFTMRPQLAAALEHLGLTAGAEPPPEPNDPIEALEGAEREAVVLHRSRERHLREAKLKAYLVTAPGGRLRCEVPGCGFDFEAVYGPPGAGYAQVHHVKPLASRTAAERTRLTDLAVVCANCHAMIHRFGANRALEGLVRRRRKG